jgi:hypothetical protein
MKKQIKWIFLTGGFCVLLAFCVFAPVIADAWTDNLTADEITYELLAYEPYEISYYSTFADKLGAIGEVISDGATPYVIPLEEREDALDDDALIQLANKELYALYQNGLLPEKYEVTEWDGRELAELYVVPQNENHEPLMDVCFWNLTAIVNNVQITICMDNSFYKIYCFMLWGENESQETDDWKNKIVQSNGENLAEGWRDYWELPDAEIVNAFDTDSYTITIVDMDMVSRYYLTLQNEQKIGLSLSYRMEGNRYVLTGIQGMMMQFGYI